MTVRHPAPWTWEEHELSEGFSCVVYDARGWRVGGLDHLDRETAALIAAAPELYAALSALAADLELHPEIKRVLGLTEYAHLNVARAALAKAEGR